jgi:hypothetical protein
VTGLTPGIRPFLVVDGRVGPWATPGYNDSSTSQKSKDVAEHSFLPKMERFM